MANGIIANQVDAAALRVDLAAAGIPTYLGQAPIWQVDDANWADLAGQSFVIKSTKEMKEKIGYSIPESGAFSKDQSLSMVAFYHEKVEKKMPVIMIVNKAAVTATDISDPVTIDFIQGKATIAGANIVLSSIVLTDGDSTTYEKGVDYTVAYDANGQNVIVSSGTLTTASATYKVVSPSSISFSKDTYEEIDYIPQNTGYIPSTISAPLWDKETDTGGDVVMAKLSAIAEEPIDKHYYLQAIGQLTSSTRTAAITEKEPFASAKLKICWPYAKIGSYIFPISLIFGARKETVDARNGGIPYESASNETVIISNLCDAAGNTIKQLESEADLLNANGITTMAFLTNMRWNTYGVCMANYTEDNRGNIPPNKLNDAAVQMMDYICNDFELQFGSIVHKPMSIRTANSIVDMYQNQLNALISQGMLIAGVISFEPSDNSRADLADGQFTYSIEETNTPPAKAIIANVTYDSDALDTYFDAIGGEE